MSTEAAFLADICENADDDGPRLVFADWLDDRGGPGDADRAEFIRVQCRLARLGPNDPGRCELVRRERELLAPHLAEWWGALPEWARGDSILGPAKAFRRGFVYEIAATARAFLAGGGELLGRSPIGSAQLAEATGQVRALAASPLLASLDRLALKGPIGAGGAEALARSPPLRRLRALDLGANGIGDVGGIALAQALTLTQLRELYLEQNGIGDPGAFALAQAPFELTALGVGQNLIGEAGADALATSPHLGGLTFLDLTGNPLGQAAGALRERFGAAVLLPRG